MHNNKINGSKMAINTDKTFYLIPHLVILLKQAQNQTKFVPSETFYRSFDATARNSCLNGFRPALVASKLRFRDF